MTQSERVIGPDGSCVVEHEWKSAEPGPDYGSKSESAPPHATRTGRVLGLDELCRCNPSQFQGGFAPDVANEWI